MTTNRGSPIYLISGRLAHALSVIVTMRIITQIFQPEELGWYFLFIAYSAFLIMVVINPSGQYFVRKAISWYKSGNLSSRLFQYLFVSAFASFIFGITLIYIFNDFIHLHQNFILAAVCFIGLIWTQSSAAFIAFLANVVGFRHIFFTVTLLFSVLNILIPYIFTIFFGEIIFWIVGIILSNLIACLTGMVMFRKFIAPQSEKTDRENLDWVEIKRYVIPLMIISGTVWVTIHALKVILNISLDLQLAGAITVGIVLGSQLFALLESIFTQLFQPYFYNGLSISIKEGAEVRLQHILSTIFPIYFLCACVVMILSDAVFMIFIDEQYHNYHWVMKFVAVFEIGRIYFNLLSLHFHGTYNTNELFLPNLIQASPLIFLFILCSVSFSFTEYQLLSIWSASGILGSYFLTARISQTINLRFPWKKIALIITSSTILFQVLPSPNNALSSIALLCASSTLLIMIHFLANRNDMEIIHRDIFNA